MEYPADVSFFLICSFVLGVRATRCNKVQNYTTQTGNYLKTHRTTAQRSVGFLPFLHFASRNQAGTFCLGASPWWPGRELHRRVRPLQLNWRDFRRAAAAQI